MTTPSDFLSQPDIGAGVHKGVSFEDYRAIKAINWSLLREVGESMEKFRFVCEHPPQEDDSYIRETMFHDFARDPSGAGLLYAEYPDVYPAIVKKEEVEKKWNMNATFCKEWVASMKVRGVKIVPHDKLYDARRMAANVRKLSKAMMLIDGGDYEVTLVWRDPNTELWCKGRLDVLKAGQIGELKGTRHSINNDPWAKVCRSMGYFCQAAMYMDGTRLSPVVLPDVPLFRFVCCMNTPPYSAACWDLYDAPDSESRGFLGYGQHIYQAYLAAVRQALTDKWWPGPTCQAPNTEPCDELTVPAWMKLEEWA